MELLQFAFISYIDCESVGLDVQSKEEIFFCTCKFMLKRTDLK